jgi:hypothetical protein
MGNRSDEAIAAAGDVRNVLDLRLTVSQSFAERRNMETETAFVHDKACPNDGVELTLGHHFGSVPDQHYQDIEGTRAQPDRLPGAFKQALDREQLERPKREDLVIYVRSIVRRV